MPRVFIVQEPLKRDEASGSVVPRINYRPLHEYGDIHFLFSWGELQDEDPLQDVSHIVWKLRTSLRNFSDEDYLVCLGNPALIGMAVAIAAECNDGTVKILDWIKNRRRYRVVDFDLSCQPRG